MVDIDTSRIQIQNILARHNEVEATLILSTIIDNASIPPLDLLTDIYRNTLNMPTFDSDTLEANNLAKDDKKKNGRYIVIPDYSLRTFTIYSENIKTKEKTTLGYYRPEAELKTHGVTDMLTENDKVRLGEYLKECDKVWFITLQPVETDDRTGIDSINQIDLFKDVNSVEKEKNKGKENE